MERPEVMRPNTVRLRELRGDRTLGAIAAGSGVGWRTIAKYESGVETERFRFNPLNSLAAYYGVPFDSLLEPMPTVQQAASVPISVPAA